MITVFYDGACGLCLREITYYRKIAPKGVFVWQDIASDPAPLEALGISQQEGLQTLHVQDAAGHMHKGVDAFICLWHGLPQFKWLATFAALPVVRQGLGVAYRLFARWRFKRQKYCLRPEPEDTTCRKP